jgi:Flp pilus assembly protein TadG
MPKAFNEMPHLMNAPRSTHARRFLRDTGGSILPIFVVVMFVVIAMIGMAIDYTRGSLANTKMQAALDATALALSSTAASLTSAALTTQATTYFNGIYTGAALGAPTITATYSNVTNPQLVMSATAVMKTSFLGLPPLNMSTINVSAASTIAWGESRLRVALVLDNTGSMADSGKIGALQTATKNLLAQLKAAAANNGDVYVSIIPFVKDVNVGGTNYNATWIDWTDWNATNGTCSRGIGISQSTCILGTWTPAAHSTWNGCITDRGLPAPTSTPSPQNYDTNVTAPSAGTVATLFPAEQYDSCPLQMKGLSYDWTSMNTLVNQMTPNGNTNQAIGLAWGWLWSAAGRSRRRRWTRTISISR